jgi:hypothetical protein
MFRRHGVNPRENLGDQRGQRQHRDAEDAVADGRLERLGRNDHPLDRLQDGAHVLDQVQGEGAGLHPPAHPDHQRIAELIAQPAQRVADRRGRLAQALGRLGDALGGHERVEDHEQVQVQAVQMNFAHAA